MKKIIMIISAAALALTVSCGGGEAKSDTGAGGEDKGVGPVKTVFVGNLDRGMATKGEQIFNMKCASCHKPDEKYVGPALRGVSKRRTPEWIMNMIMNPDGMVKENATAKGLFETYLTQMPNQNISQDEARALLEYLRSLDN